ncbi:hypothetical protein Caci_5692 [Catenulispora acidiphila DSM 44928]|uniref:Uncharacterized protein n=1 Tax=Catenulispora acidiphila (strain DSM 44928 / JCM 14897 / NBRC 102108 / NRRL B-24433 / ID139908) TaxID=479433 RepID=C7QCA2_CATAD|nr:hypothetical protein [Catenulispora acidiphila]ACU74550.1 hypothetical protein Caci_5692 [Catenulispora acidiphila DSM 44928]
MTEVSRRDLFKRSASVAATATVASVVVGESSASAATGSAGRARTFIGTVVRQDGSGLVVTAPKEHGDSVLVRPEGFPPGWVFRSGDKVTVMAGRPGLPQSAVPLLQEVSGRVQGYSQAGGVESFTVDGITVTLHETTAVLDTSPKEAAASRDSRRFLLGYTENVDGHKTAFGFRLAP